MSKKPNRNPTNETKTQQNQTILPKNPTKIQQKNPTLTVAVGCWGLQKTKQKTQHFVGFVGF
jgi:hypothetical protein